MRRWLPAVLVSVVALLGAVGGAAEAPPSPRTAEPSGCHVVGRTPEQLADLRAFVAARGPSVSSQPARTALPEGSPADPAIREAITAVIDELFACLATGAGDRSFLLASDANLVRHIDDPDEAVAFVAGLAQAPATPIAPSQPGLYAGPWDVRILPDGRVSAAIWLDAEDDHPAPGVTAIYLFVQEDGEWRLDDSFITLYAIPSATPTGKQEKRTHSKKHELVYVADLVGWPEIEPRASTPIP